MKVSVKIVSFLVFFALFLSFSPSNRVFAIDEKTAKEQLQSEIEGQIDEINFSEFEQVLLENESHGVFDNIGFKQLVSKIVDGEYVFTFDAFLDMIMDGVKTCFSPILLLLGAILVVVLLCSLFNVIKPKLSENEVSSIVFFACFSVVVIIVSQMCFGAIKNCIDGIVQIKRQMQISFPILLTLLTATGGVASVNVYQPAVVALINVVATIFSSFLLPLFLISFVFSIVGNLSNNVKLDKFIDLINSVFKWTIGLVFAVFMAYLSIQGIVASTADGVSIRTAKYAIKNYVPVLGGYISEGFNVVLAGSLLLKNGIGLASLFLLLSTVIVPIVGIVVLSLGLKLISALVQPVADKKYCSFFQTVSKNLSMLVVILIGISLMYFLTIVLIIGTSNNFI